MNLKKQLGMISNRLKEKSNLQIDEQCYNRTEKDWKMINDYLSDELCSLMSQSNNHFKQEGDIFYIKKRKYIRLLAFASGGILTDPKDKEGNPICLADGTKLIIGQKDIARFCKQHKMKLKYYYYKYVRNSYVSDEYDYNIVDEFLVGGIC